MRVASSAYTAGNTAGNTGRRMARFEQGNRAAIGNHGGGRPRRLLRDLTSRDAEKIWRELNRIAFDRQHPRHARDGFRALRELAVLTFPRPQSMILEGTVEVADVSLGIAKLAQVASRRLQEREREMKEKGVCNACAGTGTGDAFRMRSLATGNGCGSQTIHLSESTAKRVAPA
jgi:hypothetical protein